MSYCPKGNKTIEDYMQYTLLIVLATQVEIYGIVAVSSVAHVGLVRDWSREGL